MIRLRKLLRCQKGAALIEYSLLIAGVALISLAAVAILGHKTTDMVAAVAAIIPGAHTDDNAPIISGKVIETTPVTGTGATATPIKVDVVAIQGHSGLNRLGGNLGMTPPSQITTLVQEAPAYP